MKPFDLAKISNEIQIFSSDRDWDQFHSVKNLSMALSVETSELLELFQWITEEQSNEIRTNEKLFAKAEDEVADIAIYLIRILQKTGIELESAIENKLKKNAQKYPVAIVKGNATKYTNFE